MSASRTWPGTVVSELLEQRQRAKLERLQIPLQRRKGLSNQPDLLLERKPFVWLNRPRPNGVIDGIDVPVELLKKLVEPRGKSGFFNIFHAESLPTATDI